VLVETAQVVNCLPTECKAPSSNPKLTKKKKKTVKENENEKTSHRKEESFYKSHISGRTYIQII
jgi:hypothetical protein